MGRFIGHIIDRCRFGFRHLGDHWSGGHFSRLHSKPPAIGTAGTVGPSGRRPLLACPNLVSRVRPKGHSNRRLFGHIGRFRANPLPSRSFGFPHPFCYFLSTSFFLSTLRCFQLSIGGRCLGGYGFGFGFRFWRGSWNRAGSFSQTLFLRLGRLWFQVRSRLPPLLTQPEAHGPQPYRCGILPRVGVPRIGHPILFIKAVRNRDPRPHPSPSSQTLLDRFPTDIAGAEFLNDVARFLLSHRAPPSKYDTAHWRGRRQV